MSERYTILVRAQLDKVDLKSQIKQLESEIATEAIDVTTKKSAAASANLKTMENQITRWNNTLREMESRDPDIFNVEAVKSARTEFLGMIDAFSLGKVTTDDVTTSLDTLQAEVRIASDQFRMSTEHTMGFGDALANAAKKVLLWAGATQIIYGSLHAIKDGIEYIRELNKEMTVIRFVTGMTAEEVSHLSQEYSKLAQQLGVTTSEIAQGAAEWFRAGYAADEALKLKEASIRMGTLADIEAAQATNILLSMINGFKLEVDEVIPSIDKLIQLDNEMATSVEEIAVAMQYSANSAQLAGVTFDELASYIAVVSSVTRQSAQRIGNAFKSIFTRMQRVKAGFEFDDMGESINEVEEVLNRFNIATRDTMLQFRPVGDIIDEVASKWDDLANTQKQQIAGAIAGYYQVENFITLMENYDEVLRAQASAATAAGTTLERYGIYLEGVEAAQNKAIAAWERVWDITIQDEALVFFHNLSAAIGNLVADTGGLTRVVSLVVGLVTIFQAERLTAGLMLTWDKIKSIITAFKSATTAAISFNTALGVIGLALAVVSIGKMIYDFVKLEARIERSIEKMSELRASTQETANALQTLPQLWTAMEELANKTNRTSEETEQLNEIYNRLNSLIPGIAGYYDGLGQFIVDLNVPMSDYVALLEKELQLKKDIMALEAQTQMDNYLKGYSKAVGEYEKDLRLLEAMQAKFDLKQQWEDDIISQKEYTDGVQELNKALGLGLDFKRSHVFWHGTLAEGELRLAQSALGVSSAVTEVVTNFKLLDPEIQASLLETIRLTEGLEELHEKLLSFGKTGDTQIFDPHATEPIVPLEDIAVGIGEVLGEMVNLNRELETIINNFIKLGELSPEDVMKLQELFPDDYISLLTWTGEKMLLNQDALRGLAIAQAESAVAAAELAVALDETSTEAQRNLDVARALHAELINGVGSYDSLTNAIIGQTSDLYSLADAAVKTIQEYRELGSMTPQMVASFQSQYPLEFAAALEVVGGQVVLNIDRFRELVAAHAYAALSAAEHALSLDKLNVSLQLAAKSARDFYNSLKSGAFWEQAETPVLSGGGGGGAVKTQEERDLEKQIKDLEKLIKIENKHIKTIQKAIKEIQKRVKERQKLIKELQKQIKAQQKDVDVVDDEIKALNDLKKEFKEYIDLRKEQLRLLKEEEDWHLRMEKKARGLAKIRTDIAILELDDSQEARAKRLKLEEEAAKLEEEIAKDNADRKYDLQIQALDNVQLAFDEMIDQQIAALQEIIDGIQLVIDSLNEQIEVHQQYIEHLQDQIEVHNEVIEQHREQIDLFREQIELLREMLDEIEKLSGSGGGGWPKVRETAVNAIEDILDRLELQMGALGDARKELERLVGIWLRMGMSADEALAKAKRYAEYVGGRSYAQSVRDAVSTGTFVPLAVTPSGDYSFHKGGMVEEHHTGASFAGGLKSNEVYAKLLKGEYIANRHQMDNFLNKILPKLVTYAQLRDSGNAPNIQVEMPITVQGNMDSSTIPQLESITDKVIEEINKSISARGYMRTSNQVIM